MIDTRTIKLHRRHVLLAAAALLVGTAFVCQSAVALTPAEIKAKGKLVVGIQGDNPPWGFVNSSGKQEGFDADIAELFGKELGAPVEFVPLAVANRIPALTTGRVDILFATMAMLPDRAKAVQFSKPYVANTMGLVAAKTTEIKTNADMGKFVIGVHAALQRRLYAPGREGDECRGQRIHRKDPKQRRSRQNHQEMDEAGSGAIPD